MSTPMMPQGPRHAANHVHLTRTMLIISALINYNRTYCHHRASTSTIHEKTQVVTTVLYYDLCLLQLFEPKIKDRQTQYNKR